MRGHFTEWVNIARYTGRPILMGFNASSVADEFELEDDETIVAAAVDALRGMYG